MIMKNLFLYGVSILLVAGVTACNNQPENKNGEGSSFIPEYRVKSYYKRLQSAKEKDTAVLHLVKYQSKAKNKGAITTDRYQGILIQADHAPLQIAGYVGRDSVIFLVAYDHYTPVDTLSGRFEDGFFKGVQKNANGKSSGFSFREAYPEGSYRWQVATYLDSLRVDTANGQGPHAETDLMTLWPAKKINPAAASILLDTICRAFFGADKVFSAPESLLQAVSDTFLQNYRQVTAEYIKEEGTLRPSFNWNAMAHMDLTCNSGGRISLVYTQYQYTGGAHGLQSVFCLVVDVEKGKVVRLTDLFKPGYEKQLRQELEKEFRRQYDIPQGAPLNGEKGLLFDAHLPITPNFYLTKDGIGFIYNPYEVAPYVVGEINLFLPFHSLNGLLQK